MECHENDGTGCAERNNRKAILIKKDKEKAMIEKGCAECGVKASDGYALYCVKCSEPMREWIELTKDDVDSWPLLESPTVYEFSKYVEAKLKEKNHG
jgi:hypothetical protein